MLRASTTVCALLLSATLLAACDDQAPQVSVRFGAARNALQVQGLSVLLEVTQDGTLVSSDEKPVDVSGGVATAALSFSGLTLDKAATFDVTVLWGSHANRVLLHASKDISKVTDGLTVAIGDGDVVVPDGKPDSDTDGASDLAEVIAGSDPDSALSRPSSGGSIVAVTIGGVGGIARFEQSLPLTVTIDKGDGTLTTDPAAATWTVADSTIATVSATGMVLAQKLIGQTTVTASYGGATSAPVAINVQPAKVKLYCEQGTGVATVTASYCYLRTQTSTGANVDTVKGGGWHLASSDPSLLIAGAPDTYYSRGYLSAQFNDGAVTVTATYNDGTAGGMTDVVQMQVVKITAITLTAPARTDIGWQVYHDFPMTVTRENGAPLPDGFNPWYATNVVQMKYSDANVAYGFPTWPSKVSYEGTIFGVTQAWLVLGSGVVTSNKITLRAVPDVVQLGGNASINLAPGASSTPLDVNCYADGGLHVGCAVSAASAEISMVSDNSAVATATWDAPAPPAGTAGSKLTVTIHAGAAGSARITGTLNGVVGTLNVTVGP